MRAVTFLACLAACSGIGEKSDTGSGELSQDAFEDRFSDRYCTEWAACSTSQPCPLEEPTTGPGTSACDYDPVAAQACLDDPWTCNTDFPGLELIEVADACRAVCGASTPTGTTTSPM